MIDRLFNDSQPSAALEKYRRQIYAKAYIVLGLLSYGTRQFAQTRQFFVQAAVTSPAHIFKRDIIVTFLKTLLGGANIDKLKRKHARA
jgi:hypothetical protein